MTQILVAEDNPEDALLTQRLLEKSGFSVQTFENGIQVLEAIGQRADNKADTDPLPGLVLTDLVMPEMDGLELMAQVHQRFPKVPVILMTAHGSGQVALKALRQGAASYVSKRRLIEDLVDTVADVLSVASAEREQERLLVSLVNSEYRFQLDNDQSVIGTMVRFVRDKISARSASIEETVIMQIGMAIQEALRNAMHHGNLEVSSDLRQDTSRNYDALVEERLADPGFSRRKVDITIDISPVGFRCVIRDEGPGFDPSLIPDPTDPANLLKASGRGLFLISSFMDETRHNAKGNEIRLFKRFKANGASPEGPDQ